MLQGEAAGAHLTDTAMAAAEQQMPPDGGQAATRASVALPPASGHASSGRTALDEGELGSRGAQADGDAQEAAEPSAAEQPLPGSKVQAGASPEAGSSWDHQGSGQAAKQQSSDTVEHNNPVQLPAEGSAHELQQLPARATLQAGSSSQQQAGAGAGSPLLGSEGSPAMAVPRLLQSQVQSVAGSAASAERSVDRTLAGAAGPSSAGCIAAEEAEPAMTIRDSEDQAAAGQGRVVPGVPQELAAGVPAVPSPADEFLRPAVPAFLPAVFGGSLAGKQARAQPRSVSTDPVASPAESIDASAQASALSHYRFLPQQSAPSTAL